MTTGSEGMKQSTIDLGAGVVANWYETGDGSGAPLLLLHGGGAGADAYGNWKGCAPLFADAGYRVLALDLVGFGGSLGPEPGEYSYDLDSRVEFVARWLDAIGVPVAHLVGNSMGGATTLGLSIKHPDKVASQVLMGSAGLPVAISPELGRILHYTEPDLEAMRGIVAALTNDSYTLEEELVTYRYELTKNPRIMSAYVATMAWIRENGLVWPEQDIAGIDKPTLVVQGREDKVIPLESSVKLHQLLRRSNLYSMANCGHWAMIEHPGEFASITLRFLESVGR